MGRSTCPYRYDGPSTMLGQSRRPRTRSASGACGGTGASWTALGAGPARGPDVLIDMERVVGVVTVLDPGQPIVVAAVGGPDPVLALVHQEVDITAAGRSRVQLFEVIPRPLRDAVGVGGIGVDADDHARPAAVPVGEG